MVFYFDIFLATRSILMGVKRGCSLMEVEVRLRPIVWERTWIIRGYFLRFTALRM